MLHYLDAVSVYLIPALTTVISSMSTLENKIMTISLFFFFKLKFSLNWAANVGNNRLKTEYKCFPRKKLTRRIKRKYKEEEKVIMP